MASWEGIFAAKFGPTGNIAFTTSNGTASILITPPNGKAMVLLLRSDQDVHIRQGGSAITVASTDFLLLKNVYWPILIESLTDAYVALRGDSASGTLYMTNISDLTNTPGV